VHVLILGGTGLTGPHAVRRMHAFGHQVTVYHRGEREADFPAGVRHLHGDFTAFPKEALRPGPDVVVHMWAMTEADAQFFVETFRGVAGRAVVISSGDVYHAYGCMQKLESGLPDPAPLPEDAPLRQSRYPYRKMAPGPDHWMTRYDKILVEQAVMGHGGLPATVLRFPAVIGPNEHRRFHRWLQPMLRGDREVTIQDDWARWRWTHGFVEDVAEAVVLAATRPEAAGRIYNVGEPRTPAMAERLAEFARAAGWRGRLVEVPPADLPEVDRMPYDFAHHLAYDTNRIRSELGYAEVVSREDALARMLSWETEATAP